MELIIANKVLILGALLAVSECMALIPSLKASGILDGIVRILKLLLGK